MWHLIGRSPLKAYTCSLSLSPSIINENIRIIERRQQKERKEKHRENKKKKKEIR
jgi:hypothetical protein